MPDNTLIDNVQLAVAARPGDRTGVEHVVTDLEQADVTADRLDHPGHVPTQHFGGTALRLCVLADLGVHRVDRDGFDFNQHVARAGHWLGQFDVLQGVRVLDRQRLVIGDSFHGACPGSEYEK